MQEYTVKVWDIRTEWFQNGERHRIDGPAVEFKDGTEFWYQNGKLHRIDGPAVEWADGSKFWYQNYKLHKTDGPAVEYANGLVEYWENGVWKINRKNTKEMTVEQIIKELGYNVKIVK